MSLGQLMRALHTLTDRLGNAGEHIARAKTLHHPAREVAVAARMVRTVGTHARELNAQLTPERVTHARPNEIVALGRAIDAFALAALKASDCATTYGKARRPQQALTDAAKETRDAISDLRQKAYVAEVRGEYLKATQKPPRPLERLLSDITREAPPGSPMGPLDVGQVRHLQEIAILAEHMLRAAPVEAPGATLGASRPDLLRRLFIYLALGDVDWPGGHYWGDALRAAADKAV